MAKCPKCQKEMSYLRNITSTHGEFRMFIKDGLECWCCEPNDISGLQDKDEYRCPECGELLFTENELAVRFMKEA